jgi:hypothetical protein
MTANSYAANCEVYAPDLVLKDEGTVPVMHAHLMYRQMHFAKEARQTRPQAWGLSSLPVWTAALLQLAFGCHLQPLAIIVNLWQVLFTHTLTQHTDTQAYSVLHVCRPSYCCAVDPRKAYMVLASSTMQSPQGKCMR